MRADNAAAWGISGTGLGLYISRELVERHGGHMWFESQEGNGSTFYISLPALRANTSDLDSTTKESTA
jgi:signal transduction histidine kinase